MPRTARIKSYDSIYHVMIRSNGDDWLFREDKDHDRYLSLIRKYQIIFKFKVYGYCLMDNHGHLLIDCNGADISKIMHGINQSYAQYYNRQYNRRGHVFQDRFKSIVVHDDSYLVTLIEYIHSNPKDISRYNQKIDQYPYSSLGIYLGKAKDIYNIVDTDFINEIFNIKENYTKEHHFGKVNQSNDEKLKDHVEFKDQKSEYRSEYSPLIRNKSPQAIAKYIASRTGIKLSLLSTKHSRLSTQSKALCVFLMRSLCGLSYKEICSVVGNLSQTRVSKLTFIGLQAVCNDERYKGLVEDFLAS